MRSLPIVAAVLAVLVSCGRPPELDAPALTNALMVRVPTVASDDASDGIGAELEVLYGASGHAPHWMDDRGRPSRAAAAVLSVLAEAGAEGLSPEDYRVAELTTESALLAEGEIADLNRVAAFDVDMSLQLLRFLRHVHVGRINPREAGFRLTVPADLHGFGALVASAASENRVEKIVAEVRPAMPLYEPLRERLAEYRARAEASTHEELPEVSAPVKPGERYAGAEALARHLMAVGDLPDGTAPPVNGEYDGPLVEAVTRFQERHGLAPDGVLGKNTMQALSVPLSWRVRQIELALERLRWIPHLAEGRVILVNIPMFRLWTWDHMAEMGPPDASMDIIVGRALDTETPIFADELSYLVFRPYWNVPPSITQEEILPRLAREPDHLRRQQMEIVRGVTDDAEPVAFTPEHLALVEEGELRIRQRPGTHNALGLVKFMFPNEHNVYLHSTPTPELFGRARRDLSHGCVRVEDPVALAQWVLDDPAWTPETIKAAMNSGADSRVVNVAEPVQVILTYVTAMVWPQDGSIRFATDIYEHDRRLDAALSQ